MILQKSIKALFITLLLTSCVANSRLSTQPVNGDFLQGGEFNLILYGMETPYDVETVAILDRADDIYQISSRAKLEEFRIHNKLTKEEASQKAINFLNESIIIKNIEIKSILGPNREVIGYEFRPIFQPAQVENSYYDCRYILQERNNVLFTVAWNEFYKPFSGRGR